MAKPHETPSSSMSGEQFWDWFISGSPKERYAFFDALGWREGYGYCKERGYAIKTGWPVIRRLLSNK